MDRYDPYMDKALGLISVQSFPAIVGVADMMLKSSTVDLVGYEQIGGGYCTAVVRGGISDVRLAIETGEEVAAQFGQKVSSLVTARPMPNLDEILPIGSKLAGLIAGRERNRFRDHAVGLVETIGFPPMVAAADAMLKSADVSLSAYHRIGAGLCTAIIRGSVSNVAAAIEAGMAEAERVGELHSVMMIPRPLDDLERAMPLAECWLQELQPVRMPVNLADQQERELQPLEIPETVPVEIPAAEVAPMQQEAMQQAEVPSIPLETASPESTPLETTRSPQREPLKAPLQPDMMSPEYVPAAPEPQSQPPLTRPPMEQPADPLD